MLAINQLKPGSVELHLLGQWQVGFREKILSNLCAEGSSRIVYSYSPMFPEDIPRFCAQFDIGLALETCRSENSNLLLSNKVFTYLLAGNAILATRTKAQETLLQGLPEVGLLYPPGKASALAEVLERLSSDRELLRRLRDNAFHEARQRFTWDTEQYKMLELVDEELS